MQTEIACLPLIAPHKVLLWQSGRSSLTAQHPGHRQPLQLRRYSLSFAAAAWPCRKVLLFTAPLSSDSIFTHGSTTPIGCQALLYNFVNSAKSVTPFQKKMWHFAVKIPISEFCSAKRRIQTATRIIRYPLPRRAQVWILQRRTAKKVLKMRACLRFFPDN